MIRTDASGQPLISISGTAALSRPLVPGSVVQVEVLGAKTGQGTLVRIAGRIFTAAGIADLGAGDSFRARVRFSGNTVFLHPLLPGASATQSGIFDRLGLTENGISSFLVSFFQKISARLDGRTLNSLLRVAARFPRQEARAAEAAAILSERGIEPSFESVGRLLRCIEGDGAAGGDDSTGPDGGRGSDRDFLAFINHKKGQERHWIVIPFRRQIAGRSCAGSVRFLLDTASGTCLETRVTVIEGDRGWDFELTGPSCVFTANPAFKSVVFDKFVVYLESILTSIGISEVSWFYPDNRLFPLTGPVDMEA